MNIRAKQSGFTLIELVITIAIIAILASIAYPSYLNYIYESRRTDGLAALSTAQLALERCYSQNFSYAATCSSLPAFPITSSQGFYTITLSNLGVSTYTLTATPQGAQAHDSTCASISLNQANVKTAQDSSGTDEAKCWNP